MAPCSRLISGDCGHKAFLSPVTSQAVASSKVVSFAPYFSAYPIQSPGCHSPAFWEVRVELWQISTTIRRLLLTELIQIDHILYTKRCLHMVLLLLALYDFVFCYCTLVCLSLSLCMLYFGRIKIVIAAVDNVCIETTHIVRPMSFDIK